MIEKELKLMLTESEYEKLDKNLEFDEVIEQVNHYYYSAACTRRRISVRVREVGGRALLQIKLPVSTKGALAVRDERERELDSVPDSFDADTLRAVCGIDDTAKRIGSLKTLRKLSHTFEGVEICLDKNEYLGVTDYEAELEYIGEYPDKAVIYLASLGIDVDRSARGKYSRFIERLEGRE